MNERATNEEREALIADAATDALGPDEEADLALLADVLADPSTWAEPRAGLEDDVMVAVAHAQPEAPRAEHRRSRVVIGAIAAAATIAIIIGVVVTRNNTNADFDTQMTATALAPGAHASADITRNDAGFRITLDATGLPRLGNGEYYQAWLKNAAGTRVPIGTFSSSDDRVTLWSGVSPEAFPTMTVTIESTSGPVTPSRVVLAGPVRSH